MAGGEDSKAWIRAGGWLLPRVTEAKPTHLLLDGGKARVPDDSAGAFLNAYAIAVVKRVVPCVVELRTPVFKLFLDLDVKTARRASLDFDAVMRVLQLRVAAFFDTGDDPPRAVVCATEPRECGDNVKAGRHVVWTNVRATTATALAFRAAAVDDLEAALPEACAKPWSTVVDACVFQANGLRMPYSGKGRESSATYAPRQVWTGEDGEDVAAASGVAAVRRWVHELSIRTFHADATPLCAGVPVPSPAESPEGLQGTARSLLEYEDVLPQLDAALPVQFAGQRFTSVIKAESCFLLRSSSRYCLNLGRAHNSCGIYWILSLKGVRQGCYCRCDSLEGRKYGMCKDFKSEIWPVPDDVLTAFFGASASGAAVAIKAYVPDMMPSAKAKAATDWDAVLSRSRPALKKPARKRALPK